MRANWFAYEKEARALPDANLAWKEPALRIVLGQIGPAIWVLLHMHEKLSHKRSWWQKILNPERLHKAGSAWDYGFTRVQHFHATSIAEVRVVIDNSAENVAHIYVSSRDKEEILTPLSMMLALATGVTRNEDHLTIQLVRTIS
jgi:hypothetical protein